jgi:hypothetical protein
MREHDINKLNNFIGGWYLPDTSVCDKIIEYHKSSNYKREGTVNYSVDKNVKDSIDVRLEDKFLLEEYCLSNLQKIADLYRNKYNHCDTTSKWSIVEAVNIQQYKPNGGFYKWHTERASGINPLNNRHLVFMTYLNDVTDDGETEFYYQKIKVKPEKGLTLIWGADWTFTHRGIPSPSQEKYIVTGWYSFI